MPSANLHLCIRQSSIVNRKFIILLLLALPLVSCGRYKARKELEQNQIFAEILKREDRRSIGDDRFFENHLLGNRSSEVSGWCAIALGRIGNPEALSLLYSALHSGDASVRTASAFAIGECVERNPTLAPESIRALQGLLDDTSLSVRMRSVEALGKIGSQPEAAEIVRRLESYSENRDPYQRAYLSFAITALDRLKNPVAVPALERLAESEYPEIRWRALEAIAHLKPAGSISPLLIKNLRHRNPDVQARAAFLMAEAGDTGQANALLTLLMPYQEDSERPNSLPVRIRALQALAFNKNPEAVPAIRAAISAEPSDDRHPDQKSFVIAAAEALGNFQSDNSEAALLPLLKLSGPIADRAVISLAFLQGIKGRPERFFHQTGFYRNAGKISDKAWAQALGQLGDPEAIRQLHQMLQRALDTPDSRLRAIAPDVLRALAGAGTPVSEETWSQLLRQRDCALLPEAVEINSILLQSSPAPWAQAVDAFAACNSSSNIQARLRILDRLGLWSKEKDVQQLLLAGLNDPDRRIRYACHEILRNTGLPGLPAAPDPGGSTITDPIAQAISATRRNTTIAQVETTRGTMEIELFRQDAPVTVHNFVLLAQRGAYDGMELSRMIPFRIEGRIPQSRLILGRSVNSEINMRPFERGSLGMTLIEAVGDRGLYGIFGNEYSDAGGFFITLSPQPELDGVHTCFGRIVSGLQIADKIVPGDRIKKIHIKETIHIHDYRKYE